MILFEFSRYIIDVFAYVIEWRRYCPLDRVTILNSFFCNLVFFKVIIQLFDDRYYFLQSLYICIFQATITPSFMISE